MAEADRREKIKIFGRAIEILKSYGLLPADEMNFRESRFLKCMRVFIIFASLPVSGTLGYLYIVTLEQIHSEQLECTCLLMQLLFVITTIYVVYKNRRDTLLFLEIYSDYTYGKPADLRATCETLDKISSGAVYYANTCCIAFCIYQYISNPFCAGRETRGDHRYVCNVPYPFWSPFENDSEIFKWILILFTLLGTLKYFAMFLIFAIILIGSTKLVVMKVRHLRLSLDEMKTGQPAPDLMQKKLIMCIRYHSLIVETVRILNDGVGYNNLPVYLFIPVVMSMFTFRFLTYKDPTALMNLVPIFISMCVICLIGQHLEDESLQLIDSIYDLPWYTMDTKSMKIFLILLGRVQKPLQIEVRPFTKLNNLLLLQMMQKFYSILMFLIQVTT